MYTGEETRVTVKTFIDVLDDYGSTHREFTERESLINVYKYKQEKVYDPRFNNVTLIALTDDRLFSDKDNVIVYGTEYHVLYTIDSKRKFQIFLELA